MANCNRASTLIATPSQTVGPFFYLALDREEWAEMTAANPQGERIVIEGRITDGDGAAVADAFLELWQANAAGRYAHPDDARSDKPLDPNFQGFGRVATDADGQFRFTTIRPGPGAGPRQRATGAAHRRGIVRPRAPEAALHPHLLRR